VHAQTPDPARGRPRSDIAPEHEFLASALQARDLIAEAKRTVMERHGVDAEAAFDLLRHYSRTSDRPLRDVARKVVHGTWVQAE
jgi:AmiR/NasT family two-component response regulator